MPLPLVSGKILLKIKVLHDAVEERFYLNRSIKNLYTSENKKVRKRWFFKEPLTEHGSLWK